MEPEPTDQELVAAAREGAEEALCRLLERHGPPLFRMLLSFTRRQADAEDLYQEATVRAARGLAGYRDEGSFPAWLFTIGRNLWLDQRRRRALPECELTDDLPDPRVTRLPDPAGALGDRDLMAAVDELSPKLREVFLLRHYGERSFKEIAAILGAPLGTVLARMSYAVQALRPRLAGARSLRIGEVS